MYFAFSIVYYCYVDVVVTVVISIVLSVLDEEGQQRPKSTIIWALFFFTLLTSFPLFCI